LLPPDTYEINSGVGSVFDCSDDQEPLHAFCQGRLDEWLQETRIQYCIAVRVEPLCKSGESRRAGISPP
jgi:hypothetical protein